MPGIIVEDKKEPSLFSMKKLLIVAGAGMAIIIAGMGWMLMTEDSGEGIKLSLSFDTVAAENDYKVLRIRHLGGNSFTDVKNELIFVQNAPLDSQFSRRYILIDNIKTFVPGDTLYVYINMKGEYTATKELPKDTEIIDFHDGKWSVEIYDKKTFQLLYTYEWLSQNSHTVIVEDMGVSLSTKAYYTREGDTLLIFGSIYKEHVFIDKPIRLVTFRNTTIDSGNIGTAVLVRSSNVMVRGFTIQNSGNRGSEDGGIVLKNVNEVIVSHNTITYCKYGIYLDGSNGNVIINNTIKNSDVNGILLRNNALSNTVRYNNVTDNTNGIYVESGNFNIITENYVANNADYGIYIKDYKNLKNICEFNDIVNNQCLCSDTAIRDKN